MIESYGGFEEYQKQEKERKDGKGRMAFLDLMLDMLEKGDLDREGLQEEVDTFTFEVRSWISLRGCSSTYIVFLHHLFRSTLLLNFRAMTQPPPL